MFPWRGISRGTLMSMEVARAHLSPTHRVLALVGAALQAVAGFYVAFSGLLAPLWGVVVLVLVWVATTAWAVRRWRNHAFAVLVAFGVMTAFWTGFLLIGDAFFGFGA